MHHPPSALDPRISLGYQVRRCHRRIDRLLNAKLAPHGVKTGFWYYLRVLWQGDGVTQRYLSDVTHVAESTTVAMLNAMERDGLVVRSKDGEDRRKICVTLSRKARALEPKLMPVAIEVNHIATEGIDPAELAVCLSVLERAADNLARAFGAHESE